jgi:hypothetical protein
MGGNVSSVIITHKIIRRLLKRPCPAKIAGLAGKTRKPAGHPAGFQD